MNKILLAQMATLHSLGYPEHYIVQIYSFKLLKNNFDITIPIDNSPILVKVLNDKIKVNVHPDRRYMISTRSILSILHAEDCVVESGSAWRSKYTFIYFAFWEENSSQTGCTQACALALSKLETIWKLADLTILKHSLSYTSRIGEFILILHKIVSNMFEE